MNKDEFQKNRQIFRMLSSDMFNQMHNMYDQLAMSERRIENARIEGYERGYKNGYADGIGAVIVKLQEMASGEVKEE